MQSSSRLATNVYYPIWLGCSGAFAQLMDYFGRFLVITAREKDLHEKAQKKNNDGGECSGLQLHHKSEQFEVWMKGSHLTCM